MTEKAAGEAKAEIQAIVVVSKVIAKPIKDVWQVLMTDAGAEALLGVGGRLAEKGHPWRAEDGANGVIRSFHPLEQIRFTWRSSETDPKSSMVKLELSKAKVNDTMLELTHGNLASQADHDALAARWQAALDRIGEAVENA